MATDVSELVVKVTPSGISQTEDELSGVSEKFEDTADAAEKQTGLLSGFAEQMQGTAGVILAGLGVVAAGLLSQVPVIGEAIGGLNAILETLILRLDERLRPALQPIVSGMFDIANAIAEVDGPLGTLLDIILLAIPIFGLLAGALALVAGVSFLAATGVGAIIIASLPLLGVLALISLALAALFVAFQENLFGVRDLVSAVVSAIKGDFGPLAEFFEDTLNAIIGILAGFWGTFFTLSFKVSNAIFSTLRKLWARIRTGFELVFDLVVNAAKSFANVVHATIINLVNGVINAINSAIGAIESLINRAARAASRIPGVNISGVNFGRIEELAGGPLFETQRAGQIVEGAQTRLAARDRRIGRQESQANQELERQVAQLVAALQNNPIQIQTNIDGKQAARQTEPFLGEKTGDQGRSNPL